MLSSMQRKSTTGAFAPLLRRSLSVTSFSEGLLSGGMPRILITSVSFFFFSANCKALYSFRTYKYRSAHLFSIVHTEMGGPGAILDILGIAKARFLF